jgi:hypothetical protein
MAGFLDEWRKPSRLLQDVKTKSIERTLLPLIKQVRGEHFHSSLHPSHTTAPSSTLERGKRKKKRKTDFHPIEKSSSSLHSCLWNGKFDGK